ncbi:hypothetical protein F1880_006458 [Penicillium rolfsii]|nr:hypothetical protein F1880_006458 [Penicillium rolfsii]
MWWLLGNRESKKAKAHRSSHTSQSSSSRETYPQNSRDLSKSKTKMLTAALHLDNNAYGRSSLEYQIQEMIRGLPSDLKEKKKENSQSGEEASSLCDLHWSLNHYLVDHILRLVKREVTSHFRQLDAYPDLIEPVEAEILQSLRALKSLWTKPSPDDPVASNAWPYQINRCAACILARIASDKDALRNLRVVIQSRTRTRKNHRPRELNIFVDHCINRFDPVEAEELHNTASQLAFGMKRARKACVKAYMRDREDDPERDTRRKRRRHARREGSPIPCRSY